MNTGTDPTLAMVIYSLNGVLEECLTFAQNQKVHWEMAQRYLLASEGSEQD